MAKLKIPHWKQGDTSPCRVCSFHAVLEEYRRAETSELLYGERVLVGKVWDQPGPG